MSFVLKWTEEQEDTQEEHGGHGDTEYLGTSNGTKASETLATSAEKTEGSADDKPTNDAAAQKEPDPDFTVTPSKDGQLHGQYTCVLYKYWYVAFITSAKEMMFVLVCQQDN